MKLPEMQHKRLSSVVNYCSFSWGRHLLQIADIKESFFLCSLPTTTIIVIIIIIIIIIII